MRYLKFLSAVFMFAFACSVQNLNAEEKQFVATVDKDGI
jgi:hypothetical protein